MRIWFIFLSLVWAALSVTAQEKKVPFFKYDSEYNHRNEFGLYLGGGVGNYESQHFVDKVSKRYGLQQDTRYEPFSLLSFNGFYIHIINSRLAIGGLSGVGHGGEAFYNRRGGVHSFFFYGMPIVRYTYYSNKVIRLYANAGLGLGYQYLRYTGDSYFHYASMHQSGIELSYHLSPIAISLGTRRFRLFAELGFNREGIANIGFNYQF